MKTKTRLGRGWVAGGCWRVHTQVAVNVEMECR